MTEIEKIKRQIEKCQMLADIMEDERLQLQKQVIIQYRKSQFNLCGVDLFDVLKCIADGHYKAALMYMELAETGEREGDTTC